jgi:predicted O-methyltransferase YrrM
MSLLGRVATVLPMPARNLAVRYRDEWRLRRAPTVACEVGNLRPTPAEWLERALADTRSDAEWPGVAAEMGGFEITSAAGGVNPGDRRALYYVVRALRPERVLEIGTHIGASTVHIAAALRAGGPDGMLTTVDITDVNDTIAQPWRQHGSTLAPLTMVERMGMSGRVHFATAASLSFMAGSADRFDLIFLDGDHSAATVYREVPAALAHLRPGGVILMHDYFPRGRSLWPGDRVIAGPWLGIARLREEGAELAVLPLGELRWPTKLGRSVTSLAVLTRPV